MTNPFITSTARTDYNIQRNELLRQSYAAFDLEYRYNENNSQKPYTIFAASIVDSLGNIKGKHESDFANHPQPEKELVNWIMSEILQYRLTIGYNTKGIRIKKIDKKGNERYSGIDSDLKIIDDVCKYYNIPSIVGFDRRGVPYIRGYDYELRKISPFHFEKNKFNYYYHIDLYNIYNKKMVIGIYHSKYRDRKLSTVSKALLGKGKLEGLDGQIIQKLSTDKQLAYVIKDASLVMDLSRHNNYEILDLMNAISIITSIPFDRVCHTEISSWWTTILYDKINNGECKGPTLSIEERNKKKPYKGGHVLDPVIGYYNGQIVYVLDVKSLYPTMMINNNISFDTVNCSCCKDDPSASVPQEIMNLINDDKKSPIKKYWICRYKNYRGIIPRLLETFRNERFMQQSIGNQSMQLALKHLINGCYGLFGTTFFKFADYRVAELTTAFGRHTLLYMKHIAEQVYGFEVIAGDTDSIFVTNVKNKDDINKFLAECSVVLEDVEIEISAIYKKLLLLEKKHYVGINVDETKDPDVKGIEGKKSDRPIWINNLQQEFVDDIKNNRNPTVKLRKAYLDMERGQIPIGNLAISTTLRKDPSEYPEGDAEYIVGKQLNAKAGHTITYYKSNIKGKAHSDPAFLSIKQYLDMLRSIFEKQVNLLGYNYSKDVVGEKTLADYW
jgi:DNA polymerase, archaea type